MAVGSGTKRAVEDRADHVAEHFVSLAVSPPLNEAADLDRRADCEPEELQAVRVVPLHEDGFLALRLFPFRGEQLRESNDRGIVDAATTRHGRRRDMVVGLRIHGAAL